MNKVIVISDSFKGTLSSAAIAEIAETCIHEVYPHCQVIGLPVADGGDGTVDCFLKALGGTRVNCTVQGPWQDPTEACYARIGATAVIEMAAAAGLPLAAPLLDPSRTTTYGVGELIRHAVTHGATHLILGLGGSATNDGGCGAAAALGTQFFNAAGESFCPVGATLSEIVHINADETRALLRGVQVEVMCDIDNPLCGPSGAAAVFAPQKGADDAMVQRLDQGLCHLAQILAHDLGASVALLPGAGAAGGFGAGAAAFLGASLRPALKSFWICYSFLRNSGTVIWSSPEKGGLMAKAWAERSPLASPGGPSRQAYQSWPSWVLSVRTVKPSTMPASPPFFPPIGRHSPFLNWRRGLRRITAGRCATCCATPGPLRKRVNKAKTTGTAGGLRLQSRPPA